MAKNRMVKGKGLKKWKGIVVKVREDFKSGGYGKRTATEFAKRQAK